MRIKRTINLLFRFYRSYCALPLIASFAFAYIAYKYGIKTYGVLFWMKIVTDLFVLFITNNYKRKELYYYRNLGFSATMLWSITLAFDFLIFVSFIIIANFTR